VTTFIILRLHPSAPVKPVKATGDTSFTFRDFLEGLKIKVYDLSFANPTKPPTALGTAEKLALKAESGNTVPEVDLQNAQIIQHFIEKDLGGALGKARNLLSAATAVIKVDRLTKEFPTDTSFDLRLEITNNGTQIANNHLDFNISIFDDKQQNPSKRQLDYITAAPSVFVKLPAIVDPNRPPLELPTDGRPPAFEAMTAAINRVLAKDPATPSTLVDLVKTATESPAVSPAQARHIASEIVWDRAVYPPPQPDSNLKSPLEGGVSPSIRSAPSTPIHQSRTNWTPTR
jgi:hypothetical protein